MLTVSNLFFLSAGHAVNEIDELWQQTSCRQLSEGDEIWHLDRGGLALRHHPNWWTGPPGAPTSEGCKKILTLNQILTKFCTLIKTTKSLHGWSKHAHHKSRWRTAAILEKSKNRHISAMAWPIATKLGTVTHLDRWTLKPFNFGNFNNPRWQQGMLMSLLTESIFSGQAAVSMSVWKSNRKSGTAIYCITFLQHWVSLPKEQRFRDFAEICADVRNLSVFANKYSSKPASGWHFMH